MPQSKLERVSGGRRSNDQVNLGQREELRKFGIWPGFGAQPQLRPRPHERAFCPTEQMGTEKETWFVFNSLHGHFLTTDFAILIQTVSSLTLILSYFTKWLMGSKSDVRQLLLSVLFLRTKIFLLTPCEKLAHFLLSLSLPFCCLLLNYAIQFCFLLI